MYPQSALTRRQVACSGVTKPGIVDEKALNGIGLVLMWHNIRSHTGNRHRVRTTVEDTSRGHSVVGNRVSNCSIGGIERSDVVCRKAVNALTANIRVIEHIQFILLSVDPGSRSPLLKWIEVR